MKRSCQKLWLVVFSVLALAVSVVGLAPSATPSALAMPNATGNALDFDGTDDAVSIPSMPALNDFTLEYWLYPRSGDANYDRMTSTDPYVFETAKDGSGNIKFYTNPLGWTTITSAPLNTWTHLAFVRNGGTLTVYKNGISVYSGGVDTTALPTQWYLGNTKAAGEAGNETLDDVRLWNVARAQTDIQANMNTEISAQAGLVAYYKLNEGVAGGNNSGVTTANDSSGNNRNGTLSGFNLSGSTSNWVSGSGISPDCTMITVTNNADGGAGSLRQALADVCAGGTITFDPTLSGQTITLVSELVINKNLTIDGGTNAITVNGGYVTRVFNITSGDITFAHLTISQGHVGGSIARGGGVYVSAGASLHLQHVSVTGNGAVGNSGGSANGGGIYNAGSLTAQNSTFSNNSAVGGTTYYAYDGNGGNGYGGGVYNAGTFVLQNSTLNSNAGYGGSADIYDPYNGFDSGGNGAGGGVYNTGTFTVQNSTFSDNHAFGGYGGSFGSAGLGFGGGLANYNSATIQNTTLADNTSFSRGEGIYNAGTWNLVNSIVASPYGFADCFNSGSAATAYNNLSTSSSCPSATVTADARLSTLADNGGGTQTYALLPGSPAIDAGDATTCANLPGGNFDQRGVARHDGSGDGTATCDIGAYEAGTMQCSVSGGNDYTFSSQSNVALHVNATTDLSCLYVEELPINHPNATGATNGQALRTGKYWLIEGLQNDQATTATGFNVNLTLPYSSASATTRVCKWLNGAGSGFGWDCAVDSYNTNTSVTRNGLASLSQWAVGDVVGPTAVTLTNLSANSQPIELPDLSALAIGALLMAGLGGWWFARRVLKFR